MQYLTYEKYMEIGGTLEEAAFKRNMVRACGEIDSRTKCRIHAMEKVPAEVQCLCADLVDFFASNKLQGAVITGKSTAAGPVSESESYSVKNSTDISADMDDLFVSYLGSISDDNGTPLLYRGCSI